MDHDFDLHYHQNSNDIEYRTTNSNKVKYTPPSPTTSGYSESGSEMDNHDSGRVSEIENSPKIQHQRRPNTISLSMGIFNPGESEMTSPDPFPEGKSTIKINENIEQRRNHSNDSLDSSDRDVNANDCILVNVKTLKMLVDRLDEARSRLGTVETKVDAIVKAIHLQHDSSNKISKTVIALCNDFKHYSSARNSPENGRTQHKTFQSPTTNVPVPCNNNNLKHTTSSDNSKKFQSSECISQQHTLPPKTSPYADNQTATFPRFLRTDSDFLSPVSVAPSHDKESENYDNIDTEDTSAPVTGENASHYVNGNVSCNTAAIPHQSPLYAVVRKKTKLSEQSSDDVDNPPALPRRSREMMVALSGDENMQQGPSEDELEELIREVTGAEIASPSSEEELLSRSLKRTSRFSDVEDLMSVFDSSPMFSENKPGKEDAQSWQEDYDNKYSNANLNSEIKDMTGNQSPGSVAGYPLTDIDNRERFLDPVTRNGQTWHDLDVVTFPVLLNTKKTTSLQRNGGKHQHLHSVETAADVISGSKSFTSLASDNPISKGRNDKKKTSVTKGNVLRLFKRKPRKAKRSVSQNSFTFVNSPLYESETLQCVPTPDSPQTYRRGLSVDSVGNDRENSIDVTVVSSLSTLSSSQDGSVFLGDSRLNSITSEHKRRSNGFLDSPANCQLRSLQSRDDDDASSEFDNLSHFEENYDNTSLNQDDEMRPNLIKLAKQAFRNSPKLRKRAKTPNGNVPTLENKTKVPNGLIAQNNLPSVPPKVPVKLSSTNIKSSTPSVDRLQDGNIDDDVFIRPGVILDRQQREQADRLRFDNDHTPANDKPPPKPNRPGFSHGGVQGSPRSSINAHGASNGAVPGYPRGTPAVPPKSKIMTTEELTNHEAQEKLRLKQMEEAMLQQTLDQQQKQARDNARWLEQEEHMLNPDNVSANGEDPALRRGRGSSNSLADVPRTMEAPPPPNVAPSKPPRKGSRPKDEPAGPPQIQLEEVKTAPTMQLNRDDDNVYRDTMEVVKSVLSMNNITMNAKPDELFTSVKNVGAALKQLCTSLEKALPSLPEDFHREIDMAQKTTNKDLSQVINQLKLVQRFFITTQVVDYKKCLMAANQVLAIDAKNLLDVVDRARIRKMQTTQERNNQNRKGSLQGVSHGPAGYEPEDTYPDGDFL